MASTKQPSEQEQERAEHLKRGIEKIKGQRLKYRRSRRRRAAELEEKLQNSEYTTEEKREFQINYVLNESYSLRNERAHKTKTFPSDFETIRTIGKGAFGEVRIVRHKETQKVFAMKTMLKKVMIAKNQLSHMVSERDVMVDSTNNPWLVTLFYSFQDSNYLYLVMEYCGGGDLMGLLIERDILSEQMTRFYISELAAAINYVHSIGYVHRDLKPDNVLIGNDGHIRLSDFGLAKNFQNSVDAHLENWNQYITTLNIDLDKLKNEQIKDKAQKNEKTKHKKIFSTVGTPDYIAIEVLYQKGYSQSVDFWSLGVIMFECLCGYAPFHAKDPLSTCRKIVRYERYFKVPNDITLTKDCVQLMKALVCPAHRRIDWKGIQTHKWFKKIDFEKLGEYSPPFVPQMKSEYDSQRFVDAIEEEQSIDFGSEKENISQSGWSTSADNNNKVFGYTYTRKQGKQLAKMLKQ